MEITLTIKKIGKKVKIINQIYLTKLIIYPFHQYISVSLYQMNSA